MNLFLFFFLFFYIYSCISTEVFAWLLSNLYGADWLRLLYSIINDNRMTTFQHLSAICLQLWVGDLISWGLVTNVFHPDMTFMVGWSVNIENQSKYVCAHMCAHAHPHMHPPCMHTTHACMYTHTYYTDACIHTHTRTHTRTHARMHVRTHAHTISQRETDRQTDRQRSNSNLTTLIYKDRSLSSVKNQSNN